MYFNNIIIPVDTRLIYAKTNITKFCSTSPIVFTLQICKLHNYFHTFIPRTI